MSVPLQLTDSNLRLILHAFCLCADDSTIKGMMFSTPISASLGALVFSIFPKNESVGNTVSVPKLAVFRAPEPQNTLRHTGI